MQVDRWLFDQHRLGKMPSVLRFYQWSPVAISLGYHQRKYPPHWDDVVYQGQSLDIISRPTGGRAVLHQGDLTYAVITSGLTGKRTEIYKSLCQFLIAGWEKLGISLSYGQQRINPHHPSCFHTATSADLVMTNGFKFIGSAQLIEAEAILQHGSMRINPDPVLLTKVFESPFSFEHQPNFNYTLEEMIEVLIRSTEQCYNIKLNYQPLTPEEWKQIKLVPLPKLTA